MTGRYSSMAKMTKIILKKKLPCGHNRKNIVYVHRADGFNYATCKFCGSMYDNEYLFDFAARQDKPKDKKEGV
jgi:transcription elongation factor Elf1